MEAINRAIIGGSGKSSSVSVLVGGDIVGRQVTVQTGSLVAMHADGDIDLQAGRTTSETNGATQCKKRKLLGGKTTTTTAETRYESLSQGSRIKGNLVSITANGAITGEGVKISGTDGVLVQARGVLDLHEARDSRSDSSSVSVKKSGLAGSIGGVPMPIGAARRVDATSDSDTAVASSITSANDGVLLQGNGAAILQNVKADTARDLTIQGGVVPIAAATHSPPSASERYARGTQIG